MLKEVGASGQISLGKRFAGQVFEVTFHSLIGWKCCQCRPRQCAGWVCRRLDSPRCLATPW